MANDYVGRYGAALRQLSALERSTLPSAISPDAPQPGVAFGAPPQQAPGPGAFQNPGPPPPVVSALDQPTQAPQHGQPMSAQKLYEQMPAEFKDDIAKQIEGSGHDIDEVYAQKVASGEITAPKKEPTKHDKLGYIAEVALRTISNLSRQNTQGAGDWADAVLETDARHGALDEQRNALFRKSTADQVARQRALGDQTHKETREDQGALRERAGRIADTEGKQAFEMTEAEKRRKHEKELEAMHEAGANARDKDAKGEVFTSEDGNVYRLSGDKATPVTTKKKVRVAGTKGRSFEKEVEEQLKAAPRTNASGVDKDTVMRQISSRIKELKEDRKLVTELRTKGITGAKLDDEIAKRAKDQVLSEYNDVSGGGSQSGNPTQRKANVFDQF